MAQEGGSGKMSNKIKQLPAEVVEKIFAGEVIERPASVVKELVENSLDAGADSVEAVIEGGGRKLISVKDNGSGMSRDDLAICTERYTTSKISRVDDVYNIKSLGFRGEALSSIAAVSRLSITTGRNGEAWLLEIDRSGRTIKETAGKNGTKVEARGLFYNVPVRMKFLKSPETENAHIYEFMLKAALSAPEISFLLEEDGKKVLEFKKAAGLKERLYQAFGAELIKALVEVDFEHSGLKIKGYVGKPDFNKNQRNWQYVYVNGRVVSDRTVSHAVAAGFGALMPSGRYPVCFLFIGIDPGLVDVNVHPAKKEIKFVNGSLVHDAVAAAVKKTLVQYKPVPEISVNFGGAPAEKIYDPLDFPAGGLSGFAVSEPPRGELTESLPGLSQAPKMRPLGQVKNRYIVALEEEGLCIIDQHVAHEKVLYEKFRERAGKDGTQALLVPVSLELTPVKFNYLKKHLEGLRELGFDLEVFGKNTLVIRGVPLLISRVNPEKLIEELAEDLSEFSSVKQAADLKDDIIKSVACHSAFRWGDAITPDEITRLLRDFGEADTPYCPHGRPGIFRLKFDEIDKRFNRA